VKMIRFVICDDEYEYRKHMSQKLLEISETKGIEIEIIEFSSGKSIIGNAGEWIESTDVVFLDIKLKNENGIKVATDLRELGYVGEIVFLTASREEVFNSFDVKPLNYLLKHNMSSENILIEFDKILESIKKDRQSMFSYQIGQEKVMIPLNRVISFEARRRKVRMCYLDWSGAYSEVEFYSPLEYVESKVEHSFFLKPHRSYLVNPVFIDRVGKTQFILRNGEFISITRNYKDKFFKGFNNYLEYIGLEL